MINNASIFGRLTGDPELHMTAEGVPVVSFVVAVNRPYVKAGEERQADFIDCVAWRNNAEFICKWFKKSQFIGITGAIQTRNYVNKKGEKRKATELIANEVSFGGDHHESN